MDVNGVSVQGSDSEDVDSEMRDVQKRVLTVSEADKLLDETENHALKLLDKWYVVCVPWWRQFTKAIKDLELDSVPQIDNSLISEQRNNEFYLKKGLVEKIDYVLVPEKVFLQLRETFGMALEQRDVIERVVTLNRLRKHPVVEVYPRILTVRLARKPEFEAAVRVSEEQTLEDIRRSVLTALKLNSIRSDNLRFYLVHGTNRELLDLTTASAPEHYFNAQQEVHVDVDDGTGFFYEDQKLVGAGSSSSNGTVIARYPRGICGLHNLGNTCFMASALQCLSNVPPLTRYFYEREHLNDINTENPLGTGGRLAVAYGDLIRQMWSGENNCVSPRKFKNTLGEFAPRFSGYNQEDAQELLAFLLDGLHEDLNRIKKKPYQEADDNQDGKPDKEVADNAWAQYKRRNDSIIVDKMHGQLKSTLVCPVCGKISIKFDPFCFLSVPLPFLDRVILQHVVLIFGDGRKRRWAKFSISVSVLTTVGEVRDLMLSRLAQDNSIAPGEIRGLQLFTVERGSGNVTLLKNEDWILISETQKRDREIWAMQLLDEPADNPPLVVKSQDREGHPLFLPLLFSLPSPDALTRDFVEKTITPVIDNYFRKDTGSTVENGKAAVPDDDSMSGEASSAPFKLFVEYKNVLMPFPEGHENPLASVPKGNVPTIVIQWKDPTQFRDYRGDDLVDREASTGRRSVELLECVDMFAREEQLGEADSWYCPGCKDHRRAFKKLEVWRLPEFLLIHLKRFSNMRFTREKIGTNVEIPVKRLEMSDRLANEDHGPSSYELIAISHHSGSINGGHYYANAINEGTWHEYNDSMVRPMSIPPRDKYSSSSAYMLVYRLIQPALTDANIEMETDG